jgi:hypothetical protein
MDGGNMAMMTAFVRESVVL